MSSEDLWSELTLFHFCQILGIYTELDGPSIDVFSEHPDESRITNLADEIHRILLSAAPLNKAIAKI